MAVQVRRTLARLTFLEGLAYPVLVAARLGASRQGRTGVSRKQRDPPYSAEQEAHLEGKLIYAGVPVSGHDKIKQH